MPTGPPGLSTASNTGPFANPGTLEHSLWQSRVRLVCLTRFWKWQSTQGPGNARSGHFRLSSAAAGCQGKHSALDHSASQYLLLCYEIGKISRKQDRLFFFFLAHTFLSVVLVFGSWLLCHITVILKKLDHHDGETVV